MASSEKMIRLQTLFDIMNKHEIPNHLATQLEIQENSLNAAPVIHARWRVVQTKIPVIMCSNCWCEADAKHKTLYHFCPFCGARMDLRVRESK